MARGPIEVLSDGEGERPVIPSAVKGIQKASTEDPTLLDDDVDEPGTKRFQTRGKVSDASYDETNRALLAQRRVVLRRPAAAAGKGKGKAKKLVGKMARKRKASTKRAISLEEIPLPAKLVKRATGGGRGQRPGETYLTDGSGKYICGVGERATKRHVEFMATILDLIASRELRTRQQCRKKVAVLIATS